MDNSPRDALLRPSDLAEVVDRRRAALAQPGPRDVQVRDILASTDDDLRRIDEMVTSNESLVRPLSSTVLWSVGVLIVAGTFITGGLWLTGGGTVPTVLGIMLVVGGTCSGLISLIHLWSGYFLGIRVHRQDREFRTLVGELLQESLATVNDQVTTAVHTGRPLPSHLSDRVDRLNASCTDTTDHSRAELLADLGTADSLRLQLQVPHSEPHL
ncbi:MAG: hypothetical protein ACTH1D_00260 [Mycobacteriaceae bacterium]|uniref:hypothetical protein n=1 Tax=Corynebacterium sp. TaxID=1720 RepID=UPI003F9B4ED2